MARGRMSSFGFHGLRGRSRTWVADHIVFAGTITHAMKTWRFLRIVGSSNRKANHHVRMSIFHIHLSTVGESTVDLELESEFL